MAQRLILPQRLGQALATRVTLLSLLIYAILGLTVTWLLYLGYMYTATRAAEGRSAEALFDTFPELRDVSGKALIYCYSPQCGPCRPMSKEVDSLVAEGAPVFKLDITDQPTLSRELGIRATPTLILVEGRTISRMLLGVKTARFMSDLISAPAP